MLSLINFVVLVFGFRSRFTVVLFTMECIQHCIPREILP